MLVVWNNKHLLFSAWSVVGILVRSYARFYNNFFRGKIFISFEFSTWNFSFTNHGLSFYSSLKIEIDWIKRHLLSIWQIRHNRLKRWSNNMEWNNLIKTIVLCFSQTLDEDAVSFVAQTTLRLSLDMAFKSVVRHFKTSPHFWILFSHLTLTLFEDLMRSNAVEKFPSHLIEWNVWRGFWLLLKFQIVPCAMRLS